jgi:hypothetical protein
MLPSDVDEMQILIPKIKKFLLHLYMKRKLYHATKTMKQRAPYLALLQGTQSMVLSIFIQFKLNQIV